MALCPADQRLQTFMEPHTLHPQPHALHLAPYTLHHTPYNLHPKPNRFRGITLVPQGAVGMLTPNPQTLMQGMALCPADERLQTFIDDYFLDVDGPVHISIYNINKY